MTSRNRLATAGVAALVLAGVSILSAAPASAADFYVDDSELGVPETSPYPAGWFLGDVTERGHTPGSAESTPAGLVANGAYLLLHGVEGKIPAGTGLSAGDAGYVAPGLTLAEGAASFQIPVFTGDDDFTTLYADADGIASDTWYTSRPFGSGPFDFDPADGHPSASLAELVAELGDYRILAFGVNVNPGDSATVVSLDWAGDTYWFLPPVEPAPLPTDPPADIPETPAPADEILEPGQAEPGHSMTFTVSGFDPDEDVYAVWYSSPVFGGWFRADATGTITVTLSVPSSLTAGSHTLQFVGATSGWVASSSITVVALASTGPTEATVPLAVAAGGLLLLGGALFAVGWRRRMAAAAS